MAQSGKGPQEISSESELLTQTKNAGNKLLVYEFTSKDFASACDAMKGTFEELARKFSDRAEFFVLDRDKFKSKARKLKLEAYPTFVMFNGSENNVVGKVIGVKDEALKNTIEKLVI
ncbi:unnamed protein product [Urochloa decumbens]|uniref:Thioredoxin domain-containing protein n=1 Tax=Urochloa decumbens TaxID=240449 RepID=A0ABC9B693_9POAL